MKIPVEISMSDIVFAPENRNVDWRWRKIFNLMRHAYLEDDRVAKWRAACLLRAKMRTDRNYDL